MEITSVNNELVKEITKLQQTKYRNKRGKFLLEGFKPIKEAFDYGIKLEYIFVESDKIEEYNFAKEKVIKTTSSVLKKISTTDSAPEAVAVGYKPYVKEKTFNNFKKILLLENIKDPGNLGTIIRSSVAFGVDAIILFGDCADIYNPKVVRSAVGNLWKLPIFLIETVEELNKYFKDFDRVATLPKSKNLLKSFKPSYPIMLMFGSEADGLSTELVSYATNSVRIEMAETVESLNLATSVAVVLYSLLN